MSEDTTTGRPAPRRSEPDDQPPFRYDARLANEIELRWQDRWEAAGTFDAPNPSGPLAAGFERTAGRPKFYVLDYVPVPERGRPARRPPAGLHRHRRAGPVPAHDRAHRAAPVRATTASGCPAEQYAISTGQHPAVTTKRNIDNMRAAAAPAGPRARPAARDRDHRPRFYRWTQWIFLQIFNSWYDEDAGGPGRSPSWSPSSRRAPARPPAGQPGPAVAGAGRGDPPPGGRRLPAGLHLRRRWSTGAPGLGTVLANEEVTADGRSEVGNYPVFRRPLRQWMLRITAYADRLLDDLDRLDWPESIKQLQRNWIGRQRRRRDHVPAWSQTDRPGEPEHRGVHHPAGHAVRRDLHGAGARASRWSQRAGRGRPVGGRDAGRGPYQRGRRRARSSDRQRQAARDKTGVFTGAYADQPGHRRADPGVRRRLRPDGLRHRRDHGRARARRARLGVRRAAACRSWAPSVGDARTGLRR